MRYAGSPLKYSISEANHKKSVTIIEVTDDIQIKQVPLTAVHDVREVKGTLSDVMGMEYSEDYVRVILSDEIVPPDARVTVSTVFPNMIALGVQNSRTEGLEEFTVSDDINDKSKMDLFMDFFKVVNGGAEPEQEQIEIMKTVLEEMEEERHETN
jgi:exonuclease SbcD